MHLQIQKASHGGGGSKGKGHDQSKYESTAAGLEGGGGGGLGSGVGRWGDGSAKVLERGVGLDAAGFDVSCYIHHVLVYPFWSYDILNQYTNIYDFHITARLHIYRRSSWLPMEGEGAKAKDMISPRTSLLLDWEEGEGWKIVDGEMDWLRFYRSRSWLRQGEWL